MTITTKAAAAALLGRRMLDDGFSLSDAEAAVTAEAHRTGAVAEAALNALEEFTGIKRASQAVRTCASLSAVSIAPFFIR